METVTYLFKVHSGNAVLNGACFSHSKGTQVSFERPIGGVTQENLYATDIKDMGNFLASVVKRLDKDEVYTGVTCNDLYTEILRPVNNPDTIRIYVKRNDKGKVFVTKDTLVTISGIDEADMDIPVEDLGFKAVDAPIDFKYTKEPLLNAIFKAHGLPADYDRSINNPLLKAISKKRIGMETNKQDDWSFYFLPDQKRLAYNVSRHGLQKALLITKTLVDKFIPV